MDIFELSKLVAERTGEPTYKINNILRITVKIIREQIIKAQIIKLKNLLTIFIDVAPEKTYYSINSKKIEKVKRRFVLKIVPSSVLKKEINAKKTY